MKTLIKPLFLAFSAGILSLSTSLATPNPTNPIGRAGETVTYKTGIYTTREGKLSIALDKEKGVSVYIRLKSSTGKVYFIEHMNKNEKTFRVRLDVSELPDGDYQVEITNGVEQTVHLVTLSTQAPSFPNRLVAIN